MRRLVTFTVAWLFAAVAATTAAWQGVALVTDEVTDDRPAALAASDVQDRLDAATPSPASTTRTPPASAGSGVSGGSGGSTTTTTEVTTTTTTPAGPAEPAQPVPVTKTYRLEGGTATIQFSPTGVRALSVTPNPGFGVKKNEPEDTGWRVELESDAHRSRLDAWWDGGPQSRSREDPR